MKDKIYLWLKVALDCLFKIEMRVFLAKNANIFKNKKSYYKSEKTFRRFMYMQDVAKLQFLTKNLTI